MQLMKTTMILAIAMLGTAATTAAQGLSEPQARATIMASCNNVSTLQVDHQGHWHGLCSKGAMMIDPQGRVVADAGGDSGISRGAARAIASNACNNVSALSTDGNDHWTGACSKGSFAIDPSGKLAFK